MVEYAASVSASASASLQPQDGLSPWAAHGKIIYFGSIEASASRKMKEKEKCLRGMLHDSGQYICLYKMKLHVNSRFRSSFTSWCCHWPFAICFALLHRSMIHYWTGNLFRGLLTRCFRYKSTLLRASNQWSWRQWRCMWADNFRGTDHLSFDALEVIMVSQWWGFASYLPFQT